MERDLEGNDISVIWISIPALPWRE